ncbi:MAG TPA: cation:dicarboxylase symporter family transporter, partial [Opitutales bacterium]|nr:cation:dicarboxylase symporter family transporter [Opitutales bacterium]
MRKEPLAMFKKMPYLLLILIVGIYITEPFLTEALREGLYALSLTTQSVIMMALPIIIFGLLFKTVVRLANQAAKTILVIILLACSSSFLAIMVAQCIGRGVYSFDIELQIPEGPQALQPLWVWRFPKLIPNLYALIGGIALGSIVSWMRPAQAEIAARFCENIVSKILRVMTWTLPLFIAGFVVKLKHEGVMATIIEDYSFIFLIIICAQACFIGFSYFAATQFQPRRTLASIRNMLPAVLTGFSTMSSAAAMPL